jgi:hypothetical protein
VARAGEYPLERYEVEGERPLAAELIDVERAAVTAVEYGPERDERVDGEVLATVDPTRKTRRTHTHMVGRW